MKILFLNTNIGYGGASKIMVWVANQCAEAGHEVVFLTYRDATERQVLNPSIKHIHEQLEDQLGLHKNFIGCVRFIHGFIHKEKIDIAISFLSPSHWRLAMACKRTKCKTLFSERGDPTQKATGFKNKVIGKISRVMFCSADAFVFQTPMAAQSYPLVVQNRSKIIGNPIKPLIRTKERVLGGDKNIVCVARLDIRQKRQDLLIDAFCLISDKYPDYLLLLYGDGFEYDETVLKEKGKENPRVMFMGPTKDVASAIQCATMSVLSSDFEGIPNAVLESMSMGVPTVSTDCTPGGSAMLIRNYENGILVPRNNVKALAEAMEYIIANPVEAEAMGKCGTEVNDLYSEQKISTEWLSFLDKIARYEKTIQRP